MALEPSWKYTRREHHMTYNIATQLASLVKTCTFNVSDCSKLLTNQVRKVLKEKHDDGEIRIWKQIKIDLGGGTGTHFIRASHDSDASGKFFDWVQFKAGSDSRSYLPAKVLLLYQTEDRQDFALVWPAKKQQTWNGNWKQTCLPGGRWTFSHRVYQRLFLSRPKQ